MEKFMANENFFEIWFWKFAQKWSQWVFLIYIYHVQDIQVQKGWYTNVAYDKMGKLLMIKFIFLKNEYL